MLIKNIVLSITAIFLVLACDTGGGNGNIEEEIIGVGENVEFEFAKAKAFPNLRFNDPLDLQHPNDGSNRLFVAEKGGIIYVFKNDQEVGTKKVFLDISDRVYNDDLDMGFQSFAFHPNFEENGYFYVSYGSINRFRSIVSRFEVSKDSQDIADADSELIIFELEQPSPHHNVDMVSFGPDGYLYISVGDGGLDHIGTGQDLSTFFGSILRIDVDRPEKGSSYGIPPDNPFVGNDEGILEEIFAYGFRNPWRFSWDSVTDTMWLGDVGEARIEEIDIVEKGSNYGWSIVEGTLCFRPSENCDTAGLTFPVFEYRHDAEGRIFDFAAVIGGFVYRGTELPELIGNYIYADFATGEVRMLELEGTEVLTDTKLFTATIFSIVSFGVDQNQELYICSFDGNIYKIVKTEVSE